MTMIEPDRLKSVEDRSAMNLARPYPNEHAARLTDPDQYDSLRRENGAGGAGVDFIYGIKEGVSEVQAIRFSSSQYSPAEARAWLAEHDFTPIEFENATGDGEDRSLTGKYQRAEVTTFDEVQDRTYEFPFSSEFPVARYFGNEILSHEADAANLNRLNDGAPLLFNHNPDKVIGVVERAYIDGKRRRGYARVRFSRNAFAQEILSDVKDGVLRNVSFGYSIDKMEERGSGDYVATAWSPYEISVVSVPADPGVGIG
jgi:HK97 family phage prohead protease